MSKIIINKSISIPFAELTFHSAKSSGPGGQSVNKTQSQVILKWSVSKTNSLSSDEKGRVLSKLSSKVNRDGDIVISSEKHRSQHMNKTECCEKLQALVSEALYVPPKRKKTKPTKASQARRLDSKKMVGQKKRDRSRKWES